VIVFGDVRLNFSHEIRADIRSLGVNTAAKLHKQGDKRGSKAVSNKQQRNHVRRHIAAFDEHHVEKRVKEGDAQNTHSRRNDGAHGAAAEGKLERIACRVARRRAADTHVAAHRNPDTDGTRQR